MGHRAMTITIHLEGKALLQPAIHDLCTAGGSPTGAVARTLQTHMFVRAQDALGDRLRKPPVIRPDIGPGEEGSATLPELAKKGYEIYYSEIRFVTAPSDAVQEVQVTTDGLDLIPFNYGGVYRAVQLKSKTLKRQVNHEVRLTHLRVPGAIFQAILDELQGTDRIQQPLLPNFQSGPGIQGFGMVSYDHMLTGARAFCSCARPAHLHMLVEARELAPQYVPGSWPQQTIALLEQAKYADGLCHLCVAKRHSPEEAARLYGAGVDKGHKSFFDQVMFDLAMDRKTARAEIQRILGLSRWAREAKLFTIVRELLPDQRVIREASPTWLGRMRLDIYLPELSLALEHQGEQHYRPVGAFGGEKAHARVVERDALKRQLCRENGIEVLDVRFDAPITMAAMRQRLQRYL